MPRRWPGTKLSALSDYRRAGDAAAALAETRKLDLELWPLKPADVAADARARLRRRDLPAEVWQEYFSGAKAEPTCVP